MKTEQERQGNHVLLSTKHASKQGSKAGIASKRSTQASKAIGKGEGARKKGGIYRYTTKTGTKDDCSDSGTVNNTTTRHKSTGEDRWAPWSLCFAYNYAPTVSHRPRPGVHRASAAPQVIVHPLLPNHRASNSCCSLISCTFRSRQSRIFSSLILDAIRI